jgi:hypothetical protein
VVWCAGLVLCCFGLCWLVIVFEVQTQCCRQTGRGQLRREEHLCGAPRAQLVLTAVLSVRGACVLELHDGLKVAKGSETADIATGGVTGCVKAWSVVFSGSQRQCSARLRTKVQLTAQAARSDGLLWPPYCQLARTASPMPPGATPTQCCNTVDVTDWRVSFCGERLNVAY